MEKRETVSFSLWVPVTVAEIMDETVDGDSQCEKYRTVLIQAMNKYMEKPATIPLHLLEGDARRMRVTIPITLNRSDYTQLSDLSIATGLSRKKLGEILICGEVL